MLTGASCIVSQSEIVLGAVFSTLLAVVLISMVILTYMLTRRPIVLHMKEIYYVNSDAFKRAWYLVIAGTSFFTASETISALQNVREMGIPAGAFLMIKIIFASLLFAAFLELLFIMSRYVPKFGSQDEVVMQKIRANLRTELTTPKSGLVLDTPLDHSLYVGRTTLGSHVHLAHYRGVVVGITRLLEEQFGQLGDAFLQTVGRRTSRKVAMDMQAEGMDRNQMVQEFLAGIGASLVGIPGIQEESGKRTVVRIEECAVCSGMPHTGKAECHYITGLFQGLFEVICDEANATETRCYAKGDNCCEFIVEFTDSMQPQQASRSEPLLRRLRGR